MTSLRSKGLLVFNQVPLLRIDGLDLVQSKAIVRYLAEKHNLRGPNPADVAMSDMVAEGISDWRSAMGIAFEFSFGGYEQSAEQKEKARNANSKYLPFLERRISAAGSGWLVGSSMTYADVLFLEVAEQIVTADSVCLDSYPLCAALHQKMLGQARLAEFLKSDLRKSKSQDGIAGYKKTVMHTLERT